MKKRTRTEAEAWAYALALLTAIAQPRPPLDLHDVATLVSTSAQARAYASLVLVTSFWASVLPTQL